MSLQAAEIRSKKAEILYYNSEIWIVTESVNGSLKKILEI